MSSKQPIGVFDSGVGGLSVLSHIRQLLPDEDIIYVADTAHLPYGSKTSSLIKKRSLYIADFLVEQGAKAIVVACNTATAAAISLLRDHLKVPIVGMEPGIKPGIERSRNGRVAILATDGTLSSDKFQDLMRRFGQHATTIIQPCQGWVELVERRHPENMDPEALVRQQLQPLLDQGVDTLVLGCTHYPFLRTQIEQINQGQALIIDTGEAVAKQLRRRLAAENLLSPNEKSGTEHFWSSDPNPQTEGIIAELWGRPCHLNRLPR